jgi:hypothetical protein
MLINLRILSLNTYEVDRYQLPGFNPLEGLSDLNLIHLFFSLLPSLQILSSPVDVTFGVGNLYLR